MVYDEFKNLCRKSLEEEYIFLCFDRSKREIKKDIVIAMRAKTQTLNALPKQNNFD